MPYSSLKELPDGVRRVLPSAAQQLWLRTFNAVFEDTGDEDSARQAAWGNVKEAGYSKGNDGKWHKAEAEIADTTTVLSEDDQLDTAAALALPLPTPSKIHAEFKLLSFDRPNSNKDGFRFDDVSDEAIESLQGSPLYAGEDLASHPARNARATQRARHQLGTIHEAEKRQDGIYCTGSLQREYLEDLGVKPSELTKYFSVSMETTFDRARAFYKVGDKTLSYQDALAAGVAAPIGQVDDREKYDARWISPIEFSAAAFLKRGRNADSEADFLKVAATDEGEEGMDLTEILWSRVDQEAYAAHFALYPDEEKAMGAQLTTEQRKVLPRAQFAYVDSKGEGHLPIHDAAHVKNALARINQLDASMAEKRKAMRKILAAAKKFGVKVDMESPAVKAYAAYGGSMEDMMQHIREAFYKQFGNADPAYVVETYADYVIARKGDEVLRVSYKMDGEECKFGEPQKGKMVFEGEGKAAADTKPVVPAPDQKPQIDETAVRADERTKVTASLKAEFEKQKPQIEKTAVDAYKTREEAVATRIKELDGVLPITDDEREALTDKVRTADDLAYANLKNERLQAALEVARREKGSASKDTTVVLPRGGPAAKDERKDPFHVDVPVKAAQ